MSLFGQKRDGPSESDNPFSKLARTSSAPKTGAMSLFGTPAAAPASTGGLFGNNNAASTAQSSAPSLFGNAAATTNSNATQSSLPSLFGSATNTQQPQQQQQQQQQTSSLFGNANSTSSQPAKSSLFGAAAAPSSQPPITSFFNSTNTSQPQTNSLFGTATSGTQSQPAGSLFGTAATTQPAQPGGLFGASTQNQPGATSSLFGAPAAAPQAAASTMGIMNGASQASRIWSEQDQQPRQKSVPDQIRLVAQKWNPQSPSSLFQTYLYNAVPADAAPFYRPDPSEDEEKWDAALRKAPTPGSIPVLVRGFQQLGLRIIGQERHLAVLHGRLHEINNGLTDLLRRHDLEVATRTAECVRRHARLAQRSLGLAGKVQVLRNRGYALDPAEEQLRARLLALEKRVLDPALMGREEEIWARMLNLRERGRALESEFERAGQTMQQAPAEIIDEATVKKAKKILEDYDAQLAHLRTELEQVRKDFVDWESSAPNRSNGAHL